VRIDAGIAEGDTISPWYDPMIAKLIVWGPTREDACARMARALGEYQILGVANNVRFLSRLVQSRAFASADLDTALIEREHDQLFPAPQRAPDAAVAAAALAVLHEQREQAARGPGLAPWRLGSGWRLNADGTRRLRFLSSGVESAVAINETADAFELIVGDASGASTSGRAPKDASAGTTSGTALRFAFDGRQVRADAILKGERCDVFIDADHFVLERIDPLAHVGEIASDEGGIRALMPGRVVALLAEPGARVAKGQPLLILEAMKMEHTTSAPADGICEAFNVAIGEQVSEGAELVRFKPA
jgi:3-methylcrotonyl-CoA carboxylase alpha subunit